MDEWNVIAKLLVGFGILAVVIGLVMLLFGKLLPFGRLPGDIYLQKGSFSFYFPLASGLIISLLLTIVLNLLFRR